MKKLSGILHSLRVPKSSYLPIPRSLTEAAVRGDTEAVRAFLGQGSDVRERTVGYASPLHAACSFGHLEVAKLLREHGAPLTAENEMFSCIHFAAGKGFDAVVEWALESGFPLSDAPGALANAAACGRFEVVKLLLERGVEKENARVFGSGKNKRTPALFARGAGFTALADFIEGGPFDAASHAAQSKKRVETSDPAGLESGRVTDPHARAEAVKEVLALIETIADPNELDQEGIPLLVRAVITGDLHVVKAMLDAGASADARAEFGGLRPLTEAAALGLGEIVELLLDAGATVDCTDGSGRTPLMHAVSRGDPALVELLLNRGADRNKKDSSKKSVLKYVDGVHAAKIRALLQPTKTKTQAKSQRRKQG